MGMEQALALRLAERDLERAEKAVAEAKRELEAAQYRLKNAEAMKSNAFEALYAARVATA